MLVSQEGGSGPRKEGTAGVFKACTVARGGNVEEGQRGGGEKKQRELKKRKSGTVWSPTCYDSLCTCVCGLVRTLILIVNAGELKLDCPPKSWQLKILTFLAFHKKVKAYKSEGKIKTRMLQKGQIERTCKEKGNKAKGRN